MKIKHPAITLIIVFPFEYGGGETQNQYGGWELIPRGISQQKEISISMDKTQSIWYWGSFSWLFMSLRWSWTIERKKDA